jgi:hypothetical protein
VGGNSRGARGASAGTPTAVSNLEVKELHNDQQAGIFLFLPLNACKSKNGLLQMRHLADEKRCLPGERLLYVSVGGLESSRVALVAISMACAKDRIGSIRVGVHDYRTSMCLINVVYRQLQSGRADAR